MSILSLDGMPQVAASVHKRGIIDLGDLPGEETEEGLRVDLIPSSAWYINCRTALSKSQWTRISDYVRHRAGWRCEFCETTNDLRAKRYLMAHERFEYDEDTGVMRLAALICLCTDCNDVAHPGRATSVGGKTIGEITHHYAETADIGLAEAKTRMRQATADFERRSARDWRFDITLLTPWIEKIDAYDGQKRSRRD